jgi:hypothetical protein
MKTSNHPFEQLTISELGYIQGGDRSVVSPSESYQQAGISSIDNQLAAMQGGGGGGNNQMMEMLMQMMQNNGHGGDNVTQIQSPGILGSLFGGTTKVKYG